MDRNPGVLHARSGTTECGKAEPGARSIIGGFFALDIPAGDGGLLRYWGIEPDPRLTFESGWSAFAALVKSLRARRVWMPSYIGRALRTFAPHPDVGYYPVGDALVPDTGFLADVLEPGDVVLGVDYFGCAPPGDFRALARDRSDVVFVEDCAQAMSTGMEPWGSWRLFVPRKLVGVCDGAILQPVSAEVPGDLCSEPDPRIGTFEAAILRYEDPSGERQPVWHAAHEGEEAAMKARTPNNRRMSRISMTVLANAVPEDIVASRTANFAVLRTLLGDISFMDRAMPERMQAAPFVPFGFPVRLPGPERDRVRRVIFERGIYAGRHWVDVPSPADVFPAEHRLSSELMTLPCDQRYGPDDMERIADILRDALGR